MSLHILLCCWLHCLGGASIYMEKSADSEQKAIDTPYTIAIGDPLVPAAISICSIPEVESQAFAGYRREPDRLIYSVIRFYTTGMHISATTTKDHLLFLRRLII